MSLLRNLRAGIRLAFFQRVGGDDFEPGSDELVALIVFGLAVGLGCDWLITESPTEFEGYAVGTHAVWLALCLLLAYLGARESSAPRAFAVTAVMLSSPLAVGWVCYAGLRVLSDRLGGGADVLVEDAVLRAFLLVWYLPIALRSLVLGCGLARSAAAGLATAHALAAGVLLHQLPSPWYFWPAEPAWAYQPEPWPQVDAEALLHAQPGRVEEALAALAPARRDVPELFFVGFGADATQGVFMREVLFAQRLVDERFDAQGHSVALVNHHDTRAELPLATRSNLGDLLLGLGERMDEDDVLFLFLTGHGSRSHELSVEFPRLPLNTVEPDDLAGMLDAAAIPWRVVLVSACYSGGFIEPLADDRTLVITAAAADRRSFGCSNDADFTYFGRAFFSEALPEAEGFVAAFERARDRIDAWEKEEGKTPSQPQIAIASPVLERLAAIERRTRDRRVDAEAVELTTASTGIEPF